MRSPKTHMANIKQANNKNTGRTSKQRRSKNGTDETSANGNEDTQSRFRRTNVGGNKAHPKADKNAVATKTGKKGDKNKLIFTRENINAHLLNYNEHPENYKILGMLTYLFKEFRSTPTELLSKIKVLTSAKKANIVGESVEEQIINHIFLIFDLKGDFHDNLFGLLKNSTFLSTLLAGVYFSRPMDEESIEKHSSKIFAEILSLWESKASMSFADFTEEIAHLQACENLENFEVEEEESAGCSSCECEGHIEQEGDEEDVAAVLNEAAEQADEDDESSYSLVSLNDEAEINRLDTELGKMFNKDSVSEEIVNYSTLLVSCLEKIIINSHVSEIGFINNLFYLYQFSELSAAVKSAIKIFITKFGAKDALFRLYQQAALEIPQLYGLSTMFKTDCQEDFNELSFIKVAINFGHGNLIINRVDAAEFYGIYNTELGEAYTEFLVGLIVKERSLESLKELQESGKCSAPEAEAALTKRIGQLEYQAANPRAPKKESKKPKKEEAPIEAPEAESSSEASADREAASIAMPATEPIKKKSFADKIGAKIVQKKDESTKKYRWDNYKQKKKTEREERIKKENGENVKITKRSLREETENMTKNQKKKLGKNKKSKLSN